MVKRHSFDWHWKQTGQDTTFDISGPLGMSTVLTSQEDDLVIKDDDGSVDWGISSYDKGQEVLW